MGEGEKYLPIDQTLLPPDILEFTRPNHLEVVYCNSIDKEKRKRGEDWPLIAHSMIGRLRMENLLDCMKTVVNENVKGDFIETGVWRGGSCIFMRGFLKAYGIEDRSVWVADSFEGLPEPDPAKYPADAGDTLYQFDFLRVSLEEVQANFRKYDLLDEQVRFLKGWFRDTLPAAPMNEIAILRADGDLYESTMDCLNNLYDKVTAGGFVIIDDYGLVTCKAAVDDYRRQHNIVEPLIQIDSFGAYWRKQPGKAAI
jgi:O-methyltransferase